MTTQEAEYVISHREEYDDQMFHYALKVLGL